MPVKTNEIGRETNGPFTVIARYTRRVAATRLNPGDLFASDFRVLSVIGTGSMGVVYHAKQLSSGQDVALKLMHPALAADPKAVHRFQREARSLMTVESHHVARVKATGQDENTHLHWMAMDLVQGISLKEFVETHDPLPSDTVTDVVHQLFAAMAAAHSAGVVHRDLKPDNILVDVTQSPPLLKVLDFGIAKDLTSNTAFSTSPGQGTPLWTAPEQARLDDVPHPRSDIWALGLLTFYLLTGKVFWKHAQGPMNIMQLSVELMRAPIPAASERARELGVAERLPPNFDGWFAHCVTRDPAQRFDNAGAALRALMILMDRRGHPRHHLWLPVYCDALQGGVSITHDASDNGMLLLTRSKLAAEQLVKLRFTVPPTQGQTFSSEARVVRVAINEDDPDGLWRFRIAVAFEQTLDGLGPLLTQLEAELSG